MDTNPTYVPAVLRPVFHSPVYPVINVRCQPVGYEAFER